MTTPWLGGRPIYQNGVQVCEIIWSHPFPYMLRNLRPNGTVGVCFTGGKDEVKSWLDESYPGWTQ